ncbi:hypothetical protein Aca07nite_02400 [Actinoplanes capillaceus]|uniref:Uncharacterized protein n=1 Tax=Actinoplanes campanulatus TaxID=113559 RepID=A0ABQ3WBJ9_9ACTN|nr:hypothetical protein Aca07nite_02400 [Actinoplanes capillaceus]
MHQGHRDVEAPLHATRPAAHHPSGRIGEVEAFQQFADARVECASPYPEESALKGGPFRGSVCWSGGFRTGCSRTRSGNYDGECGCKPGDEQPAQTP